MTIKTPAQLRAEINTFFPDNTSGLITPALLRATTTDMVDTSAGGGNIFNVKQYGAKGDGVTDDTSAINNAIADFNSAGSGRLYFPAGNYIVPTGALNTITAAGGILGDYWEVTTVTSNSGTGLLFQISSSSMWIQNLILQNTVVPGTASVGITQLSVNGLHNCNLYNVGVVGFWTGVDWQECNNNIFENSFVQDAVQYGVRQRNIVIPDEGGGVYINSACGGGNAASVSGFRVESGGNTKFSGITIYGPGPPKAVGIGIDINYSGTQTAIIDGGTLENYATNAISAQNANNLIITNIEVLSSPTSHDAFFLNNCTRITIDNIVSQNANGSFSLFNFNGSCGFLSLGQISAANGWLHLITGMTGTGENGIINGLLTPASGNLDVTNLLAFETAAFSGCRYLVNNTSQSSPTVGQQVVSGDNGGSNIRPVYHDGTHWRYG